MKWADAKHATPLHSKVSSLGNWLLPCYHCLADARHGTEPGKVKQFQLQKVSKISQALLIYFVFNVRAQFTYVYFPSV